MRFSERYGYQPVLEAIQKESIDENLRNKLWSILYEHIFTYWDSSNQHENLFQPLIKNIWINFFKFPLDELTSSYKFKFIIKEHLYTTDWYMFYDFIEFIVIYQNSSLYDQYNQDIIYNPTLFIKEINFVLEAEKSAYRIINNQITPITSEHEIQSIEEALESTNPYSGVQQHLKQALQLMSDRQNPDYRNSIKESISAVESICKIVTRDDKATLGQALKNIKHLPPTLQLSMDKLYGYTSREDGIRHAMLEESNLTYIDAKFMLVACTNFINYLIDKTKD